MPKRIVQRTWWVTHLNVYVILVGLVLVLAGVFKVWQVADEAHRAVCALRQERITAIVGAKKFLSEHPQGIAGVTRADIERSIHIQQSTVRAFRFADC